MGAIALVSPTARLRAPHPTRLVASLDIGVSKTICLIGQAGERGEPDQPAAIDLLGAGVIGSPSAATGAASDFDACARSIQYAVEEAERSAGARLETAVASYSGPGLCTRRGQARVKVRAGVVSARDVHNAIQASVQAATPADMRVLHVTCLGFRIDEGEIVYDARGMDGHRLGAEVSVTLAPAVALEALTACAAQAGVRVSQIVAGPYAAAMAALDPEDREESLVIDLGAGSIGLAAFGPNGLEFCATAAGGGTRLTRALAGVLDTSFAAAERAKLAYAGECVGGDPRETVDAPRLGPDGRLEPARVLKRTIQQSVSDRLRAQFDGVARMLADAGITKAAHVVLVGGGASLGCAAQVAQRALGTPAVLGGVCTVSGLERAMTSAPFATAAGLLRYCAERSPQVASVSSSENVWRRHGAVAGSTAVRAWRWLKESF